MSETLDELFAEWQIKNQNTAGYFAVSIVGIIASFGFCNLISKVFHRLSKDSSLYQRVKSWQGLIRKFGDGCTIASARLPPTKVALSLLFVAINITLTFYDSPQNAGLIFIAKRFGWMALCNLCLAVFLGLKNTPLSPIAGYSYDSVNLLHKFVGCTTVLLVVLHFTFYLPGLAKLDALVSVMSMPTQKIGVAAAVGILVVFTTAIHFVRRRQYELFYIVHVVLITFILVAVGLHRPDISAKALIITIVAASMWIADRSLRFSRWIYYGYSNYCTITPLSDGATRVTMRRSIRASPGSHAFLWIPGLRLFERHPFTLVSNEPAEFVVQAKGGFTKVLYDAACKNPGARYRAAIEGPYGNVPNVFGYDKIVLVAGGTGATFAVNMALAWARKQRDPADDSSLNLVWSVRNQATLAWLDNEISELHSSAGVNVSLHVTSSAANSTIDTSQVNLLAHAQGLAQGRDIEKAIKEGLRPDSMAGYLTPGSINSSANNSQASLLPSNPNTVDSEAALKEGFDPTAHLRSARNSTIRAITYCRPDFATIFKQATCNLPSNARVLVAVCGSCTLVESVRKAVTECRSAQAPSIETYYEEFAI